MADLIPRDETKEKAIKLELPDGTTGELKVEDSNTRTSIATGQSYKKGGIIKKVTSHEEIDKLIKKSK